MQEFNITADKNSVPETPSEETLKRAHQEWVDTMNTLYQGVTTQVDPSSIR